MRKLSYQTLSVRLLSQRHSPAWRLSNQAGVPMAPAMCTGAESTEIIKIFVRLAIAIVIHSIAEFSYGWCRFDIAFKSIRVRITD